VSCEVIAVALVSLKGAHATLFPVILFQALVMSSLISGRQQMHGWCQRHFMIRHCFSHVISRIPVTMEYRSHSMK